MRRSERHHLKENAFVVVVAKLLRQLEDWGNGLVIGVVIGLGVLVVYGGYSWWSQRTDSRAGALLADALVVADAPVVPPPPAVSPTEPASEDAADGEAVAPAPSEFVQPPGSYPTFEAKVSASLPKLIAVADAYPNTQPGITARYRAAAALAVLGRHAEAAEQYQQVIERDASGVYGRMAALGLADVQISRGSFDEAIALLEQSSSTAAESELPVDGVLMQLGRAYQLAGRSGDARAAFQRVMDEFPTSLYFPNAQRELQTLQIEG